jgi:PA14 domain-containing protein
VLALSSGGRARRLLGAVMVLAAIALLARALDSLPEGLTASYFADTRWSAAVVRSAIDARISTDAIAAQWRGRPPERFSVTWSGAFVVLRGGAYTFTTASDDGSRVYVDGRLVVDNGGRHDVQAASGSVPLARGVHAIFIQYFQDGGPYAFELAWARGGDPPEPMPSWALAPRGAAFSRFLVSVAVRRLRTAALWLWLATLVGAAVVAAARDVALLGRSRDAGVVADAWLIAIGVLLLFLLLPHRVMGDGMIRYLALAELIEWRQVSGVPYSLVGPLFSAPLYFLGKAFITPDWWCARFNTFVFVAGLLAMYRLLHGRVDDRVVTRFLLLLVAASMFAYHLEGYFGEVFTAVTVAAGLLAVRAGHPAAGWTAAVVGVANTPAALVGLGLAALVQAWDTRRLRHLAPVAAAAGAIMLESWVRRGSPFVSGYEGNHGDATVLTYSGRPGFSYPLFFGLLSVLFSFGKGLVFYAPGVALPIARRVATNDTLRGCARLWLAFLVGLIVVYSKWWAWYGGLYWGPRFFVFASVPASLALAVWLSTIGGATPRALVATLAVLTLSAWVAIDGAVFDLNGLAACRDPNNEWLCLYVPEFSPLWRPFVEPTRPTVNQAAVGVYFGLAYLWLAAPIARELARLARPLAAIGFRRPAPRPRRRAP